MSTTGPACRPDDVVFSGLGTVTATAKTLQGLLDATSRSPSEASASDYRLAGFNAAPYLRNKKVLRSVAWYHGVGLAAIELCRTDAKLDADTYPSDRLGLFVGASPSSCFDNSNYIAAVQATRAPDGAYSEREFGRTSQDCLGTTLLGGLPNNVLCYGAMALSAKGANSNYLSGETSGLLALSTSVRNVAKGRLDAAVAGGYAYHSDAVVSGLHRQNGRLLALGKGSSTIAPFQEQASGTVFADGAVFLMIEKRAAAEKRGAPLLATYVSGAQATHGLGPRAHGPEVDAAATAALTYAIRRALTGGGLGVDDIGLVFATGAGLDTVDRWEIDALAAVFGTAASRPCVTALSPVTGHLMEAGGLLEVALLGALHAGVALPEALSLRGSRLDSCGFATSVDPRKPFALIIRSSLEGEFGVVVVRAP